MPTLFCRKKTGMPSSKNMNKETIKKIGDNKTRRKQAKILFNILNTNLF